jgi:alkylhydroperoxidase family enzyme
VTEHEVGPHVPHPPRITPLPEEEWTDDVRDVLASAGLGEISKLHIYTTMVRHPGLMRRWLQYGGKLLFRGKLPPRVRELAVLRIAWLCDAAYEWGQHVAIGHDVGLTTDDVERIVAGPDDPGWDEVDAVIVRAADELHGFAGLSDATWSTLSDEFDEMLLIELVMLIGMYQSVAYFLNAFGVELEDGAAGLEAR